MDARLVNEELAAFAAMLLAAREHHFAFLTFANIQSEISINKSRAVKYLEVLEKANFVSYSFMPFGDFVRKSTFSQNEEIDDETGAFTFTINKPLELLTTSEGADIFLAGNPLRIPASFDIERRRISIEGEFVDIGGSPAYVALCEILFSKPQGTFFLESEVAEFIEKKDPDANTGYRGLYNLKNQVNMKIEGATGIKSFIEYRQGRLWLG